VRAVGVAVLKAICAEAVNHCCMHAAHLWHVVLEIAGSKSAPGGSTYMQMYVLASK
jgi:hypothetical protein